jgi:hypothetical protein
MLAELHLIPLAVEEEPWKMPVVQHLTLLVEVAEPWKMLAELPIPSSKFP